MRLADRLDRTEPEHLADDGRVLEQRLLGRREAVETSGDDAVHRLRQLLERSDFSQHARELLGVERITARPRYQRLVHVGLEHRLLQTAAKTRPVSSSDSGGSEIVSAFAFPPPQPGRRSSSSGRAVQRTSSGASRMRSASSSTKSSRPSSAQCRSSRTSTSGRRSANPARKRRHAGEGFSGTLDRPALARHADQRPQLLLDPPRLVGLGDELGDRASQLLLGLRWTVRFQIPTCALTASPSAQKLTPSP